MGEYANLTVSKAEKDRELQDSGGKTYEGLKRDLSCLVLQLSSNSSVLLKFAIEFDVQTHCIGYKESKSQ